MALHGRCSVKLQQICLPTWYYSIIHASWSIGNQREKLLDQCPPHQTCQLTLWNFISQDSYIANTTYIPCRELLCHCSCNIYVCWPSVTVTNTAAVQTCLLVEFSCKMDAYWTVATQSACLLTFCHSILHVCWRCASLSAIPAGMVSHYQPCLLVWCLTINCACWCGASYRSYLLVWYITISISHAGWCGTLLYAMPAGPFCNLTNILTSWVQTEMRWLQVWCYSYRGAITSDMFANLVPLLDMPACIVQLYQTCMMGSLIQIHVFVKCFSIRQEIWYVKNPPDMPTG